MASCPYCRYEKLQNDPAQCPKCGAKLNTVDGAWWRMMERYNYKVQFSGYANAANHPGWPRGLTVGDRATTMAFVASFRAGHAEPKPSIETYLTVMYWRMSIQSGTVNSRTDALSAHLQADLDVKLVHLKSAIDAFLAGDLPTPESATNLIHACGFNENVIAAAFAYPAFADPLRYPMVDNRVAGWVNGRLDSPHAISLSRSPRKYKLAQFARNNTSLRMNDFGAYLAWVLWCRETAAHLAQKQPLIGWTAWDVERAVFQNQQLSLPPL